MNVPFRAGQTWWNRSGGGAFIERIDGATIWFTKVKHSGARTTAGALMPRSIFLRKYPLQVRPYLAPRTLQPKSAEPTWFSLRLNSKQLAEVEEVYVQLMGDTGLDAEVRQIAEDIASACAEARGDTPKSRRPELCPSRIVRVRPARPGVR